jgi:hypothetical protein
MAVRIAYAHACSAAGHQRWRLPTVACWGAGAVEVTVGIAIDCEHLGQRAAEPTLESGNETSAPQWEQ